MKQFIEIIESTNGPTLQKLLAVLKPQFPDATVAPEQWLVHFSSDAERIAAEGFTKGTPLNHDAWNFTHGNDFDHPGFNFAVEATDDDALEFWVWQFPEAVVFRSPGARCWHEDGFQQVIFWGPGVASPIYFVRLVGDRFMGLDTAEFELVDSSHAVIFSGSLFEVLDCIAGL